MADLLLTHGYFLSLDEKEREIMKPYPPLGLLYLSAFLKQSGFAVEVFDTTFAMTEELDNKLGESPGILGIYTNLITRTSVLRITEVAKRAGWTVVLGGPESANYPEEYLARGADVVVMGEGEETMRELVPLLAVDGPHRLHDVLGVVFKNENGEVVRNPDRPQIRDIDALPWPDRASIDMDRYVDVWREHHQSGSVNLITARGCPYKCRWCSHAVFGYTHRRRSYEDCASELEFINETYRPDQVWYADDVFTIHHRWLFQYSEELDRRGLHLPFETISRADRMLDERVIETLAKMGCWRIWIGSESGSQRILDAMERGVTVEQVRLATKMAQRHGIQVGMFLMWGYEGETEEDVAATIDHVKRAAPDVFFTTVAYPIKNTEYFREVAQRVSLNGDWASSTDRDYTIRGRHSRSYYRRADEWLRAAVEAHRLQSVDPPAAARHERLAVSARKELRAIAKEVEA